MEVRNFNEFYEKVLNLIGDWKVTAVEMDDDHKEMHVHVEYKNNYGFHHCPLCGYPSKLHDHRVRTIRHLDTTNYKTFIEIHLPRVECPFHGFQQDTVPFADGSAHYTKEFENEVISMLYDTPIDSVAKRLELSWGAIDGIKKRAVQRGENRRRKVTVKNIGIDETSFQKGHDYITVLLDKDNHRVLATLDGRKSETVLEWFKTQNIVDLSQLESISRTFGPLDMSDAFIKGVKDYFDNAGNLICFDRFHVAQLFTKAVNKVRRAEYAEIEREQKEIPAQDRPKNPLEKMRFNFLINSNRTDNRTGTRPEFMDITKLHLRTAKAWQIKETASTLWDYCYMGVAVKNWKKLLFWMALCRIEEIKKVGKTIRRYFYGILNAIRLKENNSMLEAANSVIQRVKKVACGFRDKTRFSTSVMFRLGKLDMLLAT
jgi:transposase